ncbi:YfhO family protein [Archangium lansingense]|uniref:YfhO family protein n=1 Tax=Archangium lansingense TaxID=2995310 RepID=A0ABT4ADM5_9BACT|nr:YfhO family protein [Archangium lansinium]MCY1079787.1 YfhO family protein [Archangium lansinium]
MPLSQQARARLAVVAATFALPLLYFHRAAFTEKIFASRDILRVYYPLKQYWAERVSQLQFPDWYPYNGLGQPYPGMLISGAFHPANLLYLLLPLGMALKLITLLSYVAALGGTYLFGRLWGLGRGAALLAGVTYTLCGYMVGISNNLLYLMAASTFPWALWGAERFLRQPSVSRAAIAALPLSLVLLSGDAQSFALCNGMLLVLVLLRPDRTGALRAAPRAGLLIVLGALLSAVQILPVLTTVRNAWPSAPTLQVATLFSFHPLRLLELVFGALYLDPGSGTAASSVMADELFQSGAGGFWVSSVYMGLPAVLLLGGALWHGRREPLTWKVAGVTLAILALTLAHHLPLYRWFYEWIPLWNAFRYPEKLLPYILFPCALGAGAGLEAVLREPLMARRLARAGFVFAGLSGLLALGEWQLRLFSSGVIHSLWKGADPVILEVLHGNFLQAAVVAAVTLGLMGGVLARPLPPVRCVAAIVGLQFAVLYLAHEGTYHVTYTDVLEQPSGFVELILKREAEAGAVRPRVYAGVEDLSPREVPEGLHPVDLMSVNFVAGLAPDTPALWHLESAGPYLPAVSRRLAGLFYSPDTSNLWIGRLSGLYHVRYLTLEARSYQQISGNREVVLAEEPRLGAGAVLLGNPNTQPRAYLATPVCVPDEPTARALLTSRAFRPGHQAVLECPAGTPREEAASAAGEPGQVRIVHYTPESVELEVEAHAPAALVLNDAFYDGWSAMLDGQPTPILPANLAVRGVRVPAGTHRVSFTYRTPHLGLGAFISLSTLGLLGIAVLVERRRRSAGAERGR